MFLIGIAPGHAHAEEILAGKLLWITREHIVLCLIVFTAVAFCLCIIRKPLSKISQNYEGAVNQGLKVVGCKYSSVTKSLFFQKLMLEMSAVV